MESLKLIGKLKRITNINQVSDNFKKREFVIETDEQYPQTINFELFQDKVSLIDTFKIGEVLEIFFNVRGREWQRDAESEIRVFNTLNAWRIQKVEGAQEEPTQQQEDDLPF